MIWTVYVRISSPWLKKIFDFRGLECLRMKDLDCLSQNIFTMVEENFWFSWSGMLQNEWFGRLISENLHHGWGKFLIFVVWNAPEWRIWIAYFRISSPEFKKIMDFDDRISSRIKNLDSWCQNIFTIVKENFWSCPKMKILPQNEGFGWLVSEYIHNGWRQFLMLMIWNTPEWRIWTAYLRISSPWLKKVKKYDVRVLLCKVHELK